MKLALNIRSIGALIARACTKPSLALLLLFTLVQHGNGSAQPLAPRIFFSDLESAPADGGENHHGAFVTLYGSSFGDSHSTGYITIGNAQAAAYPLWSDHKVTFQLGQGTRSGEIVLHRSGGQASNAIPFTVRPGRILFFPSKPHDRLSETLSHLKAGDILYLRDGTHAMELDRYEAVVNFMNSGRAGSPIALLAYPGADVSIGSSGSPRIAARTPNVERTSDHWVIGGIHFVGFQEALDVTASTDWRIVGNDFTCPNGFGPTGCIEFSQTSQVAFLGNVIHDVGPQRTTKVYHALYFTTDSNHIEVGWNTISNVLGCRAIQFHSTPTDRGTGRNQYDLHVHDNVIHDVVCDGINFATVDPSKGPVEAYNNLFYNVGRGPDPPDGSSNYTCIYIQGGSNFGDPGSGTVEIYNNTLYRCGDRRNTDSGAFAFSKGSPNQQVRLRNNLLVQDQGATLLSPNSTSAPLLAESNLVWWLSGKAAQHTPNGFTVADPMLRDPAHEDFHPMPGSPALGNGATLNLKWNLAGHERRRSDIGAY